MIENRIKNIIFNIIYNELGLKEIEDEFNRIGVPKKKISNPNGEKMISEYFFLRNDIYLDRLSDEEKAFIEDRIKGNNLEDEKLNDLIHTNMMKIILPDTDEKYVYWDAQDVEHMAPADAIVIAFHTLDYNMELSDEVQTVIVDKLNYIQEELAEKHGLKVAVLKYNEIPLMGYNEI